MQNPPVRLSYLKFDLKQSSRDAGVEEGVIFVAVSWGNRLISRMRALGIPASAAEVIYRNTDHCELDGLLSSSESEGQRGGSLETSLRGIIRAATELELVEDLNGDGTLRLSPRLQLTAECIRELEYDRAGYSVYAPHFASNSPDLSGAFVFARDLRGANLRLSAEWPDRPAYLFRPGRLIPLDP